MTSLLTRRPRLSATVLVLLLVAAIGAGTSAGGEYVDDFTVPGLESQEAQDLVAERFPGGGGDTATVVFADPRDAPALRDAPIAAALERIAGQPHVSAVDELQVARDGRTAFATVTYDARADDLGAAPRERLERATAPVSRAGVEVSMAGPVVDAGNEAQVPLGEIAGVLVALVLLLAVLRSLRAALASLVTAFLGVGLGFALLGLAAAGTSVPSLAPTMAAMLGIGAGIDYALLSASRFQEELRAGRSPREAAIRTNATAGRSAVTAAAIVLVSISGLLVTGIPFVGEVGVATGVTVLVTALVAVLLLPPLFAAAGTKMVRSRREVPVREGWAVRRPRLALVAGTLIAVALIVPAAGLSIGQPDDGNLRSDQTQRVAYDRLAAAFGPGFNGPLVVVVDGPEAAGAAERVRSAVGARADVAAVGEPVVSRSTAPSDVAAVGEPEAGGSAALMTVFPESAPQDERTADLVTDLRSRTLPAVLAGVEARALVGGYTARLVDEADRISARLPLFALAVVGLSLLLLAFTFRSLKIAALSAVFNLISIGAAYGIVHLLFQTSAGAGLLGIEEQPVVAYVPLFMFAILFGLSTDYNVFLLSRVREEWQRLGRVRPAVAVAGARTRRTITAAGAIMIVVFLGFATDPDPTIRMTGVGLATAILVDITLVRLLLAPASLALLGDRLWPSRRLQHPAVDHELSPGRAG